MHKEFIARGIERGRTTLTLTYSRLPQGNSINTKNKDLKQKLAVMEGDTASQPYQPKSIGMLLTIVGTRYYTASEKLDNYLKEAPGHQMMLMAEPHNKYDPLAVKVLDCQDDMRLIGYISSQETRKAHFLMKLHHDTQIFLHVVGLLPGFSTSLMAYPVINGEELKLFKWSDIPKDFIPLDNFSKVVRSLDTMPTEKKEALYYCLTYMRDKCTCIIPQQTLTSILNSIEHDKYSLNAHACAPTLKVDGGVNQVALGNGFLTNNL